MQDDKSVEDWAVLWRECKDGSRRKRKCSEVDSPRGDRGTGGAGIGDTEPDAQSVTLRHEGLGS
jgi:hypothetical protein